MREDPLVHPYRWLRPDLVPPAPFLQCDLLITPGGSGVLGDPGRIDEEFRKAWLPYFCRSGQWDTSLEEFTQEVDGWLPLLPEVSLPRLTGEMLAGVVHRKGATAGSLDGWGSPEFKALPVSWFDGVARIFPRLRIMVFGLRVCVMLFSLRFLRLMVMPLLLAKGLSVFFLSSIVFGPLLGCCSLRIGSGLGSRILSLVLGVVAVLLKLGTLPLLILRRCFLGLLILLFIFLLLMLLSLLVRWIGVFWIRY